MDSYMEQRAVLVNLLIADVDKLFAINSLHWLMT